MGGEGDKYQEAKNDLIPFGNPMYKAIINSLPGIDKEKVFLYHVMKYGPETTGDDVPGR